MADILYLTDLVKTLIDEVKILRVENRQLHEEVKTIREEITPKKRMPKQKVPIEKCICKTIKGTPCKNGRLPGRDMCAKHVGMTDESVAAPIPSTSAVAHKKPKVKKVTTKKVIPVHNHPIGEPPRDGVICELCETHGDLLDPDMPDADFEVVPVNGQSLEERLRIMLESEGD
jgi:hypothetical protein